MNYVEEAINCSIYTDQLFYEEILEQLDVERDFMVSCLENNIILEAEAPTGEKKGGWLHTIKETIKKIFEAFINKVKELFNNDQKWLKDNLPKLQGINFDGLNVTTLPYWKMDVSNITGILNSLQKEITNIKMNDPKLKSLQSREEVEKYGEFKKYVKRKGTFADGIKQVFKVADIEETKPVELGGNALKKQCLGDMSKYVVAYNTTVLPSLKSSYNNFNNMLNNVERELNKRKSVGESFCVLENASYCDTDLSLCLNSDILFEADGPATKPEEKKEAQSLNKVEDTSKEQPTGQNTPDGGKDKPVAKDASTEYYNYLKHAIQLNQIAIAAAMTACEEKYKAYMSILKGVISARGSK